MLAFYLVEILKRGEIVDKFLFANFQDVQKSCEISCSNSKDKITITAVDIYAGYIHNLVFKGEIVGKVTLMKVEEEPTHL